MSTRNVILRTDSYKLTHWNQYPEGTQKVYSYLEAREGADHAETVFFGLQPILKSIEGVQVDMDLVERAHKLADIHIGPGKFNREGWKHIISRHDGKLPVRIKAVAEGTPVSVGNVMMTIENTCDKCFWLTNALESLLLHVWYPTTVATVSYGVKKQLIQSLESTSDVNALEHVMFMLQDFGYRGVSSDESAEIGGTAHLVNFMGTDTLLALLFAEEHYNASLDTLGFSVPATEHSVMTALGRDGEYEQVERLISENEIGIISCVADSYDYYEFVNHVLETYDFRNRDGKFVFRPDSPTPEHPQPAQVVVWTLERIAKAYGFRKNSKGFKVIDPHVGVLWGDGIDPNGIAKICNAVQLAGFSVECLVFGMGGGLLQKVNRDTERFAIKCSAQMRDGTWYKVQKDPLDKSKKSKGGRLALTRLGGKWETLTDLGGDEYIGVLKTVFEDGEIKKTYTFDEVRANAVI